MYTFHKFTCKDFLDYFFDKGLGDICTLTMQALEKDACYQDDAWTTWYTVDDPYSIEDGPIAVIGERTADNDYGESHISIFEVVPCYQGQGLGTSILREFIDEYCKNKVTLYAEPKNVNFYKFIGFQDSGNENEYIFQK